MVLGIKIHATVGIQYGVSLEKYNDIGSIEDWFGASGTLAGNTLRFKRSHGQAQDLNLNK